MQNAKYTENTYTQRVHIMSIHFSLDTHGRIAKEKNKK